MTRLRQTIAKRLKEAQDTAAMLTTFNDVDMSAVMELRREYRDAFEKKHGIKLGLHFQDSSFVEQAFALLRKAGGPWMHYPNPIAAINDMQPDPNTAPIKTAEYLIALAESAPDYVFHPEDSAPAVQEPEPCLAEACT